MAAEENRRNGFVKLEDSSGEGLITYKRRKRGRSSSEACQARASFFSFLALFIVKIECFTSFVRKFSNFVEFGLGFGVVVCRILIFGSLIFLFRGMW